MKINTLTYISKSQTLHPHPLHQIQDNDEEEEKGITHIEPFFSMGHMERKSRTVNTFNNQTKEQTYKHRAQWVGFKK